MEPARYPTELEEPLLLSSERRLRIRPLRRGEVDLVRALYARLSPATRRRRFFTSMPSLPESTALLLAGVDYRRTLGLVAEHDGRNPEVVALGGFGAIDDRHVDLGLVVRDDWQRQGIGVALATRVIAAASRRGFDRYVAHFEWDNVAIRQLIRRVGEVVSMSMFGPTVVMTFVRRGDDTADPDGADDGGDRELEAVAKA